LVAAVFLAIGLIPFLECWCSSVTIRAGGRNDLEIGLTINGKVSATDAGTLARPGYSLWDTQRLRWLLVHVVAIDGL
jgi:hypothetical protein